VPQSRPLREIPLKVQKSFSHRSLASGVAAQGSGIVATDKERDAPAKGTQTEATAYINDWLGLPAQRSKLEEFERGTSSRKGKKRKSRGHQFR